MYIENKSAGEGLHGPARIGRVSFNRTGKTLSYGGRKFQSLKGHGFKANYFDVESGEAFWISGPRKDGQAAPVEIDEDVADEYWREIRGRMGGAS